MKNSSHRGCFRLHLGFVHGTCSRWRPLAWLALALLCGACANTQAGVDPPPGDPRQQDAGTASESAFFFPTALALVPDLDVLLVSNSNADLRFNGATITPLDLSLIPADVRAMSGLLDSEGRPRCLTDRQISSALECGEAPFIINNAVIRLGTFPGDMKLVHNGRRLLIPVRAEEMSLTWVDIVPLTGGTGNRLDLRCNDECDAIGGAQDCDLWDCDMSHQVINSARLDSDIPIEPFGISASDLSPVYIAADGRRSSCLSDPQSAACNCDSGSAKPFCGPGRRRDCCEPLPPADAAHAYVSHLAGGEVSFFYSVGPTSGASVPSSERVQLRDIQEGFFVADGDTLGAFGLASTVPGDPLSPTYVSSIIDRNLGAFVVGDHTEIVPTVGPRISSLDPGDDVRGVAYDGPSNTLYAVNRQPAALTAIKLSTDTDGGFGQPLWDSEVCGQPSIVKLGPDPRCLRGPTPNDCDPSRLAYIVCFEDAQIFVVDTEKRRVDGRIFTGSGPNALLLDLRPEQGIMRAFVTHFLEGTVGMIDLDPDHSETYRQMIVRLGRAEDLVQQ